MSGFDTVVSRIRQSLNPGLSEGPNNSAAAPPHAAAPAPATAGELRAQFIAALKAVGGDVIEASDEAGAMDRVAELLHSTGVRSAVIGEGITTNSASAAARLSCEGCRVDRIGEPDDTQTALKKKLASADVGIVEVDYAIAPTGTLVMLANASRPRSLSLLPPINIAILRSSRILPDLAAVLRAVGPQMIAAHPMVMVTGPSRTADIEKRIVIGVHGPRQLFVVIISHDGDVSGPAVTA